MKKELKGFVCGFTTMAVLSAGVASASGFWDTINVLRNDISVVVNGENITADNFVYNDTTYLPLRAVSTALGQSVVYDETENTAYIGKRSDNTVIKSKYIPPDEIINDWGKVIFEDGIYYVTTWFLESMYGTDVVGGDVNNKSYIFKLKDGTTKECKWVVINSSTVIPYDTYVDEIEPLLK